MRVRVEHKVTSSKTTEVVFFSIVGSILIGIGFGAGAGIFAAAAAFAFGYPASKNEAKEDANRLINNKIPERFLQDAMRGGRGKVTVKTELKNIHPGVPPLGRLLIGDKLTKETTYYFHE